MRHTQLLIFEITTACNLASAHDRCPAHDPARYRMLDTVRPLSDGDIIDAVAAARRHGFQGLIGWHYYCEPLLAWTRLRALMRALRALYPPARFALWTNGELFGPALWPDVADLCERVWISDYGQRDWSALRRLHPGVTVLSGVLDNRIDRALAPGDQRCLRPYNELIFDYYGHARLCCMDFHGEVVLGDLRRDGFDAVARRFLALRADLGREPLPRHVPTICRACAARCPQICTLDPVTLGALRDETDLPLPPEYAR